MPHKKSKKSIRDQATKDRGYDNPPTNAPIPVPNTAIAGKLAPNPFSKRKRTSGKSKSTTNLDSFGGRKDLGGLSKSAYRILNAETVRQEYRANKKMRLEEDEKGTNQTKKQSITPLPYESIGAFNRRVEVEMRPAINKAIKASRASTIKSKSVRTQKEKDKAEPSLKEHTEESNKLQAKSRQAEKNGKARATPTDSVDPFVPPEKPDRGRTGMTEFATASQRRSVADVVDAPPILKGARRGLGSVTYFDKPLPSSRVPISMHQQKVFALEREKAIAMYRDLKEAREKEQRQEHGKL